MTEKTSNIQKTPFARLLDVGRSMLDVGCFRKFLLPVLPLIICGCVHFHPEPLVPAETADAFGNRSLTNAALKTFLETNLHREFAAWPETPWDFDMLACAAYYYHP